MQRIQAALKAVADKLALTNARLARARRRHHRQHARAVRNHNLQIATQKQADRLRATDPAGAVKLDRKAARAEHRAHASHIRAQNLVGRIKRLVQRVNGLETDQASLLKALVEWRKTHGVQIIGNTAKGGTRRQRLVAVALGSAAACAAGNRPNFYSQIGAWDISHCITGEHYGERSDCSSWVTSAYHSCGCPDPNGNSYNGGYTGTLVAHGTQVPAAQKQPGDLVLYGSGTAHHVEMFVGPGETTIGHGSPPVDKGTVDLFGDGQYRIFRYF